MQQVYPSNAATNLNVRSQIQNNLRANSDLATRFNVSEQTISKWKNRDFTQDASCKPFEYGVCFVRFRKSTGYQFAEILLDVH